MLLDELMNKLSKVKKGAFIHIEYKSNPKPLAAHKGDVIQKVSSGAYRLGIKYANLKVNQNKVIVPMVWGEWYSKDFQNYIITHTNKQGETKQYLRIYTTPGQKSVTKWFLNGVECTKRWLVENGYIIDEPHDEISCFNIQVDNLIKVGI